ncbi:MAG: NAD(P)/FAD-dependent oxidoreductase, partial [Candidatus Thorarchaeota archaeon]
GYGPGGAAAATAARTFDPKSEIVIYTGETLDAHRKPGASYALEHPHTKDLIIQDWSINALSNRRIRVVSGITIDGVDTSKRTITGTDSKGKNFEDSYDKIVVATGGLPSVPSIPGVNLQGVYTIQDMADTSKIGASLSGMNRILVIGAGFSGLEVAERLLSIGKQVHLIVRSRLMRRQLEQPMSDELLSRIPKGLVVHQGVSPISIEGEDFATGVNLDGELLEGDAVLFMTGVKPNTKLAIQMGLELGSLGGIKVNESMETSKQGVYAVGDCVEMSDSLSGKSILMPIGSVAARAGRQAGVAAVGGRKIYDDTSLLFQYDRLFETDIVCVGNSSTRASEVGIKTNIHYLEDSAEFSKVAVVTNDEDQVIGGQVIAARLGARIGYQILERVESKAIFRDRPLLDSTHKRMKDLIEQTFGPIR